MAIFPGAISTDADLYIAVNQKTTQLTDNPLTAGATTANVVSTTGFPTVGFISIDGEIIKYTGTTATSFTGLTRGADGTTAAAHAQNSQVYHNVIAAHHNVLKDEIIAVESYLSTHLGLTTIVTAAEFERLSGVTSAIQTQLNAKATDTLVVHLAGSETITGVKTFQDQRLLLQETGGTDVATISVASLATSRLLTIPDPGAAASFVMTEGTATINGAKTFSSLLTVDLTTNTLPFAIKRNGAGTVAKLENTGGTVDLEFFPSSVSKWRLGHGIATSGFDLRDTVNNRTSFTVDATTSAFSGLGTNTNDSASAGFQGEVVRSSVGAVNAAATSQFNDATSISLTAGDWDIFAVADCESNGATWSEYNIGIGDTAGNSSSGTVTGESLARCAFASTSTVHTNGTLMVRKRLQLTATTTVYLKQRFVFSAGTPRTAGSSLYARRMR